MGGLGGDNMTIIIVCFLHGKPWETLVEKCKKNHADKKASTKLSGPAFTQFDRLSSDGPFSDVAILKASDESQNAESGSSSSHTSSPSSSPVSGDEKFDKFETIVGSSVENPNENLKENEMKIDEPEQDIEVEKVQEKLQAVPANSTEELVESEFSSNSKQEITNVAEEKDDDEEAQRVKQENEEKEVEETTQKSKEIKLSETESPQTIENESSSVPIDKTVSNNE